MSAFYAPNVDINTPSTAPGSIGVGLNAGSALTTGQNNVIIGPNVGSTTLATGSNNILIGTSSATDTAAAGTSNTMIIGGGATPVISATNINGTPSVSFPGSLIGGSVGGVSSGSFSATSNTTLANVTGLSATLVSAGTYVFNGYLSTTNNATGGLKIALSGGTATATAVLADCWTYNGSTISNETNSTSLAGPLVNAAVAATAVEFSGTIVVNAGGTVILQAAQNTSNATPLTILNNSFIVFTRVA